VDIGVVDTEGEDDPDPDLDQEAHPLYAEEVDQEVVLMAVDNKETKDQIPDQDLVIDTGREFQNTEVIKENLFQIVNQNRQEIIKSIEAVQEEKVDLIQGQNPMSVDDHVIVEDPKGLVKDLRVIGKVVTHQNHSEKKVMDSEADQCQWKRAGTRTLGLMRKKREIHGPIQFLIKNEETRIYRIVDLRTTMEI